MTINPYHKKNGLSPNGDSPHYEPKESHVFPLFLQNDGKNHLPLGIIKCGFVLLFALVACGLLFPESIAQAAVSPWDFPQLVRVDNRHIAFSEKEYSRGKIDSIYLMSRFNEGWVISINFFHYKTWFANKWVVQIILVNPDGTSREFAHDFDKKKIISHPDKLYLSDGVNSVDGSGDVYLVDFNFKELACHLQFTNILNSWAPAAPWEQILESEEAFVYRIVTSPWARVNGWITIDGRKTAVQGQGYADKTLTVDPMSKLNPFLHVMRVYSREQVPQEQRWQINLLTSVSLSEPGSVRVPFLIIARGNDWVLVSEQYDLAPRDFVVHKESGYEYPTRITVGCNAKGYKLTGEYVCRQLSSYVDILEEVPAWARFFVLLFFKRPVKFYCTGVFKGSLTLPDGKVVGLELEGPYTYVVLK